MESVNYNNSDCSERAKCTCDVDVRYCLRCSGVSGGTSVSLDILNRVHQAYEDRIEVVDRLPGIRKLEMKVEVLQSWVGDLEDQNCLLVKAVEELEAAATESLNRERARHAEALKDTEVDSCASARQIIKQNEVLQKINMEKDRNIQKLLADIRKYEHTISSMRDDIYSSRMTFQSAEEVNKKDAEVMAGTSFVCNENGSGTSMNDDMPRSPERLRALDLNTKQSTIEDIRKLRKANTALNEELRALRCACAAMDEERRSIGKRSRLKDELIREMRHQLKHARIRLSELRENMEDHENVESSELGLATSQHNSLESLRSLWSKRRRAAVGVAGQERGERGERGGRGDKLGGGGGGGGGGFGDDCNISESRS